MKSPSYLSQQKEFVSDDSAFNKLYPFPKFISKKMAIVTIVFIICIFLFSLLINLILTIST